MLEAGISDDDSTEIHKCSKVIGIFASLTQERSQQHAVGILICLVIRLTKLPSSQQKASLAVGPLGTVEAECDDGQVKRSAREPCHGVLVKLVLKTLKHCGFDCSL